MMTEEDLRKTREAFGERLREARLTMGFTQAELAELLIREERIPDPAVVAHWEAGRHSPKAEYIPRLAEILETTPDVLFGFALNARNESSHGTVRWIEDLPWEVSEDIRHEIANGIHLFRLMLMENMNLNELVASPHWERFGRSGHNSATLSRTFRVAVASGGLRMTHVERDREKEAALLERYKVYNLRHVRVARIPTCLMPVMKTELIALAAANGAFPKSAPNLTIGLGSGYTIRRMAELTPACSVGFAGTQWVPLVIERNNQAGYNANAAEYTAATLAHRHPGSSPVHIRFLTPEARTETGDRGVQLLTHLNINGDIFCSVGSAERHPELSQATEEFGSSDGEGVSHNFQRIKDELERKGLYDQVAAELLGVFLDHQGQFVGTETVRDLFDEHIFTVDLGRLQNFGRRKTIWVVAAGGHKSEAVRIVLRNQLCNALVIDEAIADHLLNADSD